MPQNGNVAFDGGTLQSTAELPFAEGTLRRKQQQKSHGLTSTPDESLIAIQQWKGVCMSACKLPVQIRKRLAHSSSAGCPPQLQLTVLLLSNGPGGKISVRKTSHCPCTEKGDTPLIWLPSKTRGQQKVKVCELSRFAGQHQECCYSSSVK